MAIETIILPLVLSMMLICYGFFVEVTLPRVLMRLKPSVLARYPNALDVLHDLENSRRPLEPWPCRRTPYSA